ncbi:MAG: hypothetical protein HQM08_01780 [Candidatus Riflebacteria bacterium]|nr:hypothetical protein [Candidatus Riflebacteria bacterium]
MLGVTPVGIYTDSPIESRRFYMQTLGLEQVYPVGEKNRNAAEGTVLKLESPQLEVMTVQTKLVKHGNPVTISENSRLILHPNDAEKLFEKLVNNGIEIAIGTSGLYSFTDLNGIVWEISKSTKH